jgi:hypothetical protein
MTSLQSWLPPSKNSRPSLFTHPDAWQAKARKHAVRTRIQVRAAIVALATITAGLVLWLVIGG